MFNSINNKPDNLTWLLILLLTLIKTSQSLEEVYRLVVYLSEIILYINLVSIEQINM